MLKRTAVLVTGLALTVMTGASADNDALYGEGTGDLGPVVVIESTEPAIVQEEIYLTAAEEAAMAESVSSDVILVLNDSSEADFVGSALAREAFEFAPSLDSGDTSDSLERLNAVQAP